MPTRDAHAAAAGLFQEAGNGNGAVVIGVESTLWRSSCGLQSSYASRIRFHVPTRRVCSCVVVVEADVSFRQSLVLGCRGLLGFLQRTQRWSVSLGFENSYTRS